MQAAPVGVVKVLQCNRNRILLKNPSTSLRTRRVFLYQGFRLVRSQLTFFEGGGGGGGGSGGGVVAS